MMDDTAPCLPETELSTTSDNGDRKLVIQPERSPLLRHDKDSSSKEDGHGRSQRKRKEHKKKHKSKEKKRDRKKRRHRRD